MNLPRIFARCCALVVVAMALVTRTASAAPTKPNVLVILADDAGWGDYSFNGNTNITTPNVDSIGKAGAVLDRFFVCPVCSPTRAEFLTGRYHPRGGVHSTSTGGERLNLDEMTIFQTFKASGYATGAFGKWHNGTQWPYHPNARGVDEYYGFTSGHWGNYFDAMMDHNGQITTGKGFIIDDLTDHAMKFIEDNKDKNFFCYVPFNTPHHPCQVPDQFYDMFKNADIKMRYGGTGEDIEETKAILAMVQNHDWNVGRLLKKLDELKLAENTIVLFFSDNGPQTWRWNGGMKGKKGSTDEGGVREPFVIRWPGHIAAGSKIPQIAGALDLLPTLADMAGVPVASKKPLDGVSLKPLLLADAKKADAPNWPDRMIFHTWGGKVSVRTQQFRLDNAKGLFDMTTDPGQQHDVSKDHADVTARLSKAAADWKKEMKPKAEKDGDPRPFTVGFGDTFPTQLPARDGVAHGGIKRSAGAPNCSFFQNWKTTKDSITWNIEVGAAGKYDAVIYYTCPAADVGSNIELSFNGSKIDATVSEAHDPPLYGMEHDRVKRTAESYVKDFKPLKLGLMDLQPGKGELTLRALKVPGSHVMDVRMVVMTLQK
jgi:arylsulfatase A-like enzyme